jgi:hypothetical protein
MLTICATTFRPRAHINFFFKNYLWIIIHDIKPHSIHSKPEVPFGMTFLLPHTAQRGPDKLETKQKKTKHPPITITKLKTKSVNCAFILPFSGTMPRCIAPRYNLRARFIAANYVHDETYNTKSMINLIHLCDIQSKLF